MKLDVILSDHKLQCFRTVMGSSVHYGLLAVDKAEIKQWLTLLFFSPPPPPQVKMGCAVCLLGLSQDLPERCCYFQLAVLLTQIHSKHFLFFLYLLYMSQKYPNPSNQPTKLEYFEESLDTLFGLLFYIQLPQDTVSVVVLFLHGWNSDFSFDSPLAQTSAFYHKCPIFPQSCSLLACQTWQLWRLLMQQKLAH